MIRCAAPLCPYCGQPFAGIRLLVTGGPTLPVSGVRLGRSNLGRDPHISHEHAIIERFGPEFRLTSLGGNGTYRFSGGNWLRLPDRKPVLLQVGDRIRFAQTTEASEFLE